MWPQGINIISLVRSRQITQHSSSSELSTWPHTALLTGAPCIYEHHPEPAPPSQNHQQCTFQQISLRSTQHKLSPSPIVKSQMMRALHAVFQCLTWILCVH